MIYNNSNYNTDWDIKALNQLGEFKRGKSKHRPRNDKKLFDNGNYPLVQTGEITAANLFIWSHSAKYNEFGLKQSKLWRENTLCITIAANIAETALLGYPMCFPDSIVGFNAYPNESSELFMHYIFTYIKKSIQNSASGSIQDNINIEYLTSLNFRIPNKKYQDRIVEVLFNLDSKIELNNRINAELEAMAKTLYDYWFVQFDFPDEKGRPYKSSGGKMVWNEELKREIPEGWEVENLKNNSLSHLIKPGIDKFEEEKIYLATADVENNDINFKADKITYENRESRANMQPIANSVWFAKMKNSKKVLYFAEYSEEFINNYILSTGFAGVKCEKYSLEYLFNFINNKNFEFIKDRLSNGATQEAINNDSMTYIHLIVPQKVILENYHKRTKNIYQLIYNNQIENYKLSELRDWLLPMLMNGQVQVR